MKPLKCLIAFGIAVLVATLVLVLPESGQASERDSFYPIYLSNSKGKPIRLRWIYTVNEGQPLTFIQDGVRVKLHPGRLRVVVDPTTSRLTFELAGRIGGQLYGNATLRATERLTLTKEGKVAVTRWNLNVVANLSARGESATIAVNLLTRLIPPQEMVLDRNDLDRYEIGHQFESPSPTLMHVKGSICGESAGQSRCSRINRKFDLTGEPPEQWTITEQIPSLTVGGRTYTDVVVVKSTEVYPAERDVLGGGAATSETVEMTCWLARGIGMVKGQLRDDSLGQPLQFELQATNIR